MALSRQDYETILQRQASGELAILIDVSGWRQLLMKVDVAKLESLAKRPLGGSIALIKLLSTSDLLVLLVAACLSIPAFKWWAAAVAPLTLLGGGLYKSRASIGRQKVVLVGTIFILALVVAIVNSSWGLWVRAYIVCAATALLLMRLLYVATNIIVFRLIYASYEFFAEFYLKPEGALLPLIWTQPEYSGSPEVA